MIKLFKNKLGGFDILAIVFSILWITILLLDYFNKHPIYFESFKHFKYPKLVGFLAVYSVLYIWSIETLRQLRSKIASFSFMIINILSIIILILAVCVSFTKYYVKDLDLADYIHILGLALFVLLIGTAILFTCYCLGRRLSETFLINRIFANSHFTVDLAIGIMALTFILFPLAWFQLLFPVVVILLLLLVVGINYKISLSALKGIVRFNPDFNRVQLLIFYLIGVFCLFNFLFILSPYPLGFDSRNYYINLPLLIAQNHGLVEGFQPYYWELFESIGKIITNKIEVTMFLSQVGALLAAISSYHLATRFGKIEKTYALLIAILLVVTPAISRQMFIELKVDLGLLYIQMSTVVIFISYIVYPAKSHRATLISSILLGIILGFGLGVKLLNIFLIYGLFIALSIDKKNVFSLLSVALIGLSAVLFLDLDEATGLGYYHSNVDQLSYFLLLTGAIMGIWYIYKNLDEAKNKITQMAIILFFAILTFSPWVIKAYHDSPDSNLLSLVRGSGSGHELNRDLLDRKYKELFNE